MIYMFFVHQHVSVKFTGIPFAVAGSLLGKLLSQLRIICSLGQR
jgi:hypothetical protein